MINNDSAHLYLPLPTHTYLIYRLRLCSRTCYICLCPLKCVYMADFEISQLAAPTAVFLIIFLAYSTQVLFYFLEPGPLTGWQTFQFNALVFCIWICYARSCFVDPGTITLHSAVHQTKYCKKCEAPKPPRAHHCKSCGKCIPKMDHHCPWTNNCVSHYTFPHFIRFLFYATASMSYLEYLLLIRVSVLWENRQLPSVR